MLYLEFLLISMNQYNINFAWPHTANSIDSQLTQLFPHSLLETEHGLEIYNIGTRSSTKVSGEKPPEVHGADKPLE